MAICASGLLLSALILIIVLNDILSYKIFHMIQHLILGIIACALFFTLCNYGLELINWVLLALIPLYFFIRWIYILTSTPTSAPVSTSSPTSTKVITPDSGCNEDTCEDECPVCETPNETCECPKNTTYEINIEKKKPVLCKSTSLSFNKSKILEF
jgi:hypothetical protein